MKLNREKTLEVIALALALIGGFLYYYNAIYTLPLYWDATIHGIMARDLLLYWPFNFSSTYPPFYLYLINSFEVLVKWYHPTNLLILASSVFLWLVLYIILKKVSRNNIISLMLLMVWIYSSKSILYAWRLYMEVLLAGIILLSSYFIYQYLQSKNKKHLFLALIFWVISALIKQQWLFILLPSYVIALGIFHYFWYIRFPIKSYKLYILLIVILISWYWLLFHNEWKLVIWNDDNKILNTINYIGQTVFNYSWTKNHKFYSIQDAIEYSKTINIKFIEEPYLNTKLQNILYDKYDQGSLRNRLVKTVRPKDFFTSYKKYNMIMNIYGKENFFQFFIFMFQLIWIIALIVHSDKSTKLWFFWVMIFIGCNIVFFTRNEDQQRYHFYMMYYWIILTSFWLRLLIQKVQLSKFVYLIAFCATVISIPLDSTWQFNIIKNQYRTQIYSSSKWGIESIKKVGSRLNINTSPESKIRMMCGNELAYYSNRKVSADRQSYFLTKEEIQTYLTLKDDKYMVILDSQLVDNNDWSGLCKIPKDFKKIIEDLYLQQPIDWAPDLYLYSIKSKK